MRTQFNMQNTERPIILKWRLDSPQVKEVFHLYEIINKGCTRKRNNR